MTARIAVVFDASAAASFAASGMSVGEVLTEVSDEAAVACLPLPCLVAAARAGADQDHLEVLARNPVVRVDGGDVRSWRALAATYEIVNSYEGAVAALTAMKNGVAVLTSEVGMYRALGEDLTIPIVES